MDVTFFTEFEKGIKIKADEIHHGSFLASGHFTKENIVELLECFMVEYSVRADNLWRLSANFSTTLLEIEDENLMDMAVHWSDRSSWENTGVNPMDLAGFLLEIKYAYNDSDKRVCILFD